MPLCTMNLARCPNTTSSQWKCTQENQHKSRLANVYSRPCPIVRVAHSRGVNVTLSYPQEINRFYLFSAFKSIRQYVRNILTELLLFAGFSSSTFGFGPYAARTVPRYCVQSNFFLFLFFLSFLQKIENQIKIKKYLPPSPRPPLFCFRERVVSGKQKSGVPFLKTSLPRPHAHTRTHTHTHTHTQAHTRTHTQAHA